MKNKKTQAYIMAIIGFLLLLFNVINYLFNLNYAQPILTIMGIIFVAVGLKSARSS